MDVVRTLAKGQFNSAEVLSYLPPPLQTKLNIYTLTGALKKITQFRYLGRNEFNLVGGKNSKRVTNKDVFVELLEKSDRPMHKKELLEDALSLKGKWIDPKIQIQAAPPLEAIGKNWWALDYWEREKKQVPIESAVQNRSKEIITTRPEKKDKVTSSTSQYSF